jgi:hypothetical protein
MRQRAGLVEHPFGTLKRWFGWDHFLVRGFEKVGGRDEHHGARLQPHARDQHARGEGLHGVLRPQRTHKEYSSPIGNGGVSYYALFWTWC